MDPLLIRARLRFFGARMALARAARAHGGVVVGFARVVAGSVAPWLVTSLSITREGHVVKANPCSLGVLRDDPPYTWWWLRAEADVPGFTLLYVNLRSLVAKRSQRDWGLTVASEDEAFDERHIASLHQPSPERIATARTMLADPEVRRLLEELLAGEDDNCTIGFHISLTRRRAGLSFDDALMQMERVAALALALENAFRSKFPYR